MLKYPFALLCLLLILGTACQRNSDTFFLKSEGAVMPVRIAGKARSHQYLVILPGGPAGDGQLYRRVFPMFRKQLEPKLKVVYYDQRGSGASGGTIEPASLSLAQLSQDLDRIIEVIKEEDKRAEIYLLGYSFGGSLGMHYLLDPVHQAKVEGFIGLCGAYNRKLQAKYQQQLIGGLLDHWVEQGEITNYRTLLTEYRCADQVNPERCERDSLLRLSDLLIRIEDLERYNHFPLSGKNIGNLLSGVFYSPSNPITSGINESHNGIYFQSEFDSLLLGDQVSVIETPSLLMAGRYDTNVPYFDAQEIINLLGTEKDNKQLLILEKSGHLPMFTEPDLIAAEILKFVDH